MKTLLVPLLALSAALGGGQAKAMPVNSILQREVRVQDFDIAYTGPGSPFALGGAFDDSISHTFFDEEGQSARAEAAQQSDIDVTGHYKGTGTVYYESMIPAGHQFRTSSWIAIEFDLLALHVLEVSGVVKTLKLGDEPTDPGHGGAVAPFGGGGYTVVGPGLNSTNFALHRNDVRQYGSTELLGPGHYRVEFGAYLFTQGINVGAGSVSYDLDLRLRPVPVPTSFGLMVAGLAAIAASGRRRNRPIETT